MTEPIFLQGICKDYLWGGNRLREEYGKKSDADKIAESWELACHKDGSSILTHRGRCRKGPPGIPGRTRYRFSRHKLRRLHHRSGTD